MTREELYVYICERISFIPSNVVKRDDILYMVWTRKHMFVVIEIHKDHVRVCLNRRREGMETTNIQI
jgi:hypothetical protein